MTTPIPCDDEHCTLPSAYVRNGVLVIESKHHGERHRCTVSLHYLHKLLTESGTTVLDSASTTVSTPLPVLPP